MRSFGSLGFMLFVLLATGWVANCDVSGTRSTELVEANQTGASPGGQVVAPPSQAGGVPGQGVTSPGLGVTAPVPGIAAPSQGVAVSGPPSAADNAGGGDDDSDDDDKVAVSGPPSAASKGGAAGGNAGSGESGDDGGKGGGRMCTTESQKYKGVCLSKQICASICVMEGFQPGHCSALHGTCECVKPC